MGRILALDLGSKRIGLAISDPLKIIAQPFKTIDFKSDEKLLLELEQIIKGEKIELILIGYPLHAEGQESKGCAKAKALACALKAKGLAVELVDERYTSQKARSIIKEVGQRIKNNRPAVDRLAAALILKDYLENQRDKTK